MRIFSIRPGLRRAAAAGCTLAVLATAAGLRGQEAGPPAAKMGPYLVQQSLDFGYRTVSVDGSAANYDTFVNLGSGFRLLNQSLEAHAVAGTGGAFDNLSLTSFGLGGDPQAVARLHVDKGQWYDFSGSFRRDENVFNYNLLTNPLNPANNNPEVAVSGALHELDLSHRLANYDLRLLPLARVSLRLGYARNVETGPAYTTLHGNVDTQLFENYRTIMNSFHLGVDWKPVARTVISYDQFLEYFKQDTSLSDQNQNYQLSNGIPVDLGINFRGTAPCSNAIVNAGTTPPTASNTCSSYLSYSRLAPARSSLPTERLSLHSNYFNNVDISGDFGYNSGRNTVANYAELANGLAASVQRASQTLSGAEANRVSVNGNGAVAWNITPRLRLMDTATLYRFENPGDYFYSENVQFAQGPLLPGNLGSLLQAPAIFNAANCPAPYTALACPQHLSSSVADVQTGIEYSYLGENTKTETLQIAYDFTQRWSGRIGYRYTNQKIADGDSAFLTSETFNPGNGAALAFRGVCALVKGVPPAGCSANPDGSATYTNPTPATAVSPMQAANIHGNALLLGMSARPSDKIRLSTDLEFYDADRVFDRMTPRESQRYDLHGAYTPRAWVKLDATVDIRENRDNDVLVNELDHARSYNVAAEFIPGGRLSLELGYNHSDLYSQALLCFSLGSSPVPAGVGACPIPSSPVPQGALGSYSDLDHFLFSDVNWKPVARVAVKLGYAGSFTRGSTLMLNPLAPPGPLQFNYQKPFVGLDAGLTKNLAYSAAYGYFGYHELAGTGVAGLAPIPGEDFRTNTLTTSMRFIF